MVMIDMQMADKNILDQLLGVAHGNDIPQCARSKIEEKAVPVAQLDHDTGACLVYSRREWGAAHEGDAHLVWTDLFAVRKVIVSAL